MSRAGHLRLVPAPTPARPHAVISIGLDVGQRVDPSAIVVCEAQWRRDAEGRSVCHFMGRHVGRLPLGTTYPAIAEHLRKLCEQLRSKSVTPPCLYLDATGVGIPVFDALKDKRVRATIYPVWFNHGDRLAWKVDDAGMGQWSMGKAFLVSRLQSLFQHQRLHLPQTPETEVLSKELQDYEIKISQNANDTYGAFKVGTHDDLVTALGLATLRDPVRQELPAPVALQGMTVGPRAVERAGIRLGSVGAY